MSDREMSRARALLGSALFFVIAPGVLAGLVPWEITQWRFSAAPFGVEALRVLGGAFILAGLVVLIESFARFALQGRGTPAPVAPPTELVVSGFYKRVRNPIYVALLAIILGQAMLFADARLAFYAALFWLTTHLFVVYAEEPRLTHKFGAAYEAYRASTPRWLPKL